jgi:hypothetical protein
MLPAFVPKPVAEHIRDGIRCDGRRNTPNKAGIQRISTYPRLLPKGIAKLMDMKIKKERYPPANGTALVSTFKACLVFKKFTKDWSFAKYPDVYKIIDHDPDATFDHVRVIYYDMLSRLYPDSKSFLEAIDADLRLPRKEPTKSLKKYMKSIKNGSLLARRAEKKNK